MILLQTHGKAVSKNADLLKEATALLQVQQDTWTTIEDFLNQSLCIVNYSQSATVSDACNKNNMGNEV